MVLIFSSSSSQDNSFLLEEFGLSEVDSYFIWMISLNNFILLYHTLYHLTISNPTSCYSTKKFANTVNRTKVKEDNGMRPLKGKVSITLDSDIIQTIKDYAEEDDRSFSQYINMVLKEYISRRSRTEKG